MYRTICTLCGVRLDRDDAGRLISEIDRDNAGRHTDHRGAGVSEALATMAAAAFA